MDVLAESEIDYPSIARELDKTKVSIFMGKNSAFFGSLMCSMNFFWSRSTRTAATDGVSLWWNPDWFVQLKPRTREMVLLHELWHAARLHPLRGQSLMHKEWNQACDIRINNDLENELHSFEGVENCWKNQGMDANGIMVEEEIYNYLTKNNIPPGPSGSWGDGSGDGDLVPMTSENKQIAVNNVVQAIQQAKLSGAPGDIPGGVEEMIKIFLEPIIPWQQVLMQFFTDLLYDDHTWSRPNRRYSDMYLPSKFTDDGRLEHLIYFLDVSGSINGGNILRFNSEVKYIQEELKPQRLTLVQFDTKIQKVDEFTEDDPFDEINVIGRGGTSLVPVRAYIQEHKPTAAIIFSDLYCQPMDPLDIDIPVIWVVVENKKATVPFGKKIHI